MDAQRVEGEFEQQLGGSWKTPVPQNADPIAKPHSADRTRSSSANLEDPDCRVEALERHRETDGVPGLALPVRPRDETLEALDGSGRRRNESGNLLGRQEREQRLGVRARSSRSFTFAPGAPAARGANRWRGTSPVTADGARLDDVQIYA